MDGLLGDHDADLRVAIGQRCAPVDVLLELTRGEPVGLEVTEPGDRDVTVAPDFRLRIELVVEQEADAEGVPDADAELARLNGIDRGESAEGERRATRLRLVSVFRQGWVALLVAMLRQEPWPQGRFVPEPWPAVPAWEEEAPEPQWALPKAA